jgi:hypothetical protein
MNQSIVNSGHFQPSLDLKIAAPVPNLDATPMKKAPAANRQLAIWPVAMICIGGIATLAWSGFLIWHTARALIGWISGEI